MAQGIQSANDISLSFFGVFKVFWVCPRCNYLNKKEFGANAVMYGVDIVCSNTEVCGYRKVILDLRFEISGYYQDCNDVPLNRS